MDLNSFEAWAAAKSSRSVKIELGTPLSSREFTVKIWVYDFELGTGQFVESVEEINLEEKRIEQARRNLEEAQRTIDRYSKQEAEAEAIIAEGRTQDGTQQAETSGRSDETSQGPRS